MIGYRYIVIFIIAILPWVLNAQEREGLRQLSGGPGGEEEDTPRQPEKTVVSRVVSWNVINQGAFIDSVRLDTLNKNFHNFHPAYKNSITNTYTGNYGGAYLSNTFTNRKYNTEYYFARTFDAYMLTPEKLDYYNTTTPYTMLDYSQSENKNRQNETRFNVLHSQNVNSSLNFTFRYDQAKSDGQYNFQEARNNAISLYSSYNTERINAYGGFVSNRIRNQENGGMVDDSQLLEIEKQQFIPMKLTDAKSDLKSLYFFATGEYKLGTTVGDEETKTFRPIASVIYHFKLAKFVKHFWEGEEGDNSEFFPEYFINPLLTHDSTRFRSLNNQVQLLFHESAQKKFSFGQRAFIGANTDNRVYIAPGYESPVFPFHEGEYNGGIFVGPVQRWNRKSYTNAYIGGGIFRHLGDFWTWGFEGKQYFSGYLAGQTELRGEISKPVTFWNDTLAGFKISGDLLNRVPDYFQNEYFSNRYQWSNNFVNEQVMDVSFEFASPKRSLVAGASYALINNFIYHGSNGIPAQTRSEQLVLSAFIDKDFNLGNFSMKTHVLWQKASAPQFLHLPEISVRFMPSYNMIISKVLYTQIGVDVRYNTSYYADAYNPATGYFYIQNEKKLGDYPYMDAFANLKLKRTRVFFQYMNVGSLFLNKPYFTTLGHPMNRATFRLGVAWSFYN